MKFAKSIFIIVGLSIVTLAMCTLLSYFLSKESFADFKLGWPFMFYYQFEIKGETGLGVQHGSWPMNLVYDCMLSFAFAILIFLGFKKVKLLSEHGTQI